MRKFLFVTAYFFYAVIADGQVSFSELPKDSAIVPRNLITNKGTVKISGAVSRPGVFYKTIEVKKYRNNILTDSFFTTLVYTKGIANFSFEIAINAELVNYKFEVYGNVSHTATLLQAIKGIVAGDAFIIQGQSNAAAGESNGSSNAENQNNFIRVWGSGNSNGYVAKWNIANGDIWDWGGEGNAGQWGLRVAKKIRDAYNIPIAIFNGANSGAPISWFQRDSSDSLNQYTNYGRLLRRVTETGFNNNIRAIFWYQGESDSYSGNDIEVYKTSFYNLYKGWMNDFPGFEHLYIIQIKQGCSHPVVAVNKIQQAQLELANEISNAAIYATNGTEHAGDQCHYNYNPGYRITAESLFPLVNRDIYNAPDTVNIESPQIVRAVQTGNKQLTLYFKNKNDSYVWEAGTENDFVLEGSDAEISSGLIVDSTVVLKLNKKPSYIQTISFRGHKAGGPPCVRNINGEGLTGFYRLPVNASAIKNNFAMIEEKKQSIFITPNPAHDKLFLQFTLSKLSAVFISIADVTGSIIKVIDAGKQSSGSNSITININELNQGIYFIRLQAGDFTYIQKFLKD